MDAPLPNVICPHCGTENPQSPIVTMCSKCFGSLEGAKPAAPAAPAPAGPVAATPLTSVILPAATASVPPAAAPTPSPERPRRPSPPLPPIATEPELDIQLEPSAPADQGQGTPPLDDNLRLCPACGHRLDPADMRCLYCGRPAAPPRSMPSSPRVEAKPQTPKSACSGCGCQLFILLIIAFIGVRPDRALRLNPGEMVAWVVVDTQGERGTAVRVRETVWPPGKPAPGEFDAFTPGVAERIRSAYASRAVNPMVAPPTVPPRSRAMQDAMKAAARATQPFPSGGMGMAGGERRLLCRLRWAGLIEPALYDFTVYDPTQEMQLRVQGPR